MSKREPNKTKRERKKVDLADRYQKIGISAVAAALRCQKEKKPTTCLHGDSKRKTAASGAPVDLRNIRLSSSCGQKTFDHWTRSELTTACSGTYSVRSFGPLTRKIRRDLYRPGWWTY